MAKEGRDGDEKVLRGGKGEKGKGEMMEEKEEGRGGLKKRLSF